MLNRTPSGYTLVIRLPPVGVEPEAASTMGCMVADDSDPAQRRGRRWRRLGLLLQALLVLALLVFLVIDDRLVIDPEPYLAAPFGVLLAAAGLVLANQVAVALRFHLLVRSVAAPLGRWAALRVCAWGNVIGLLGLGGGGGDLARLVLLRRHGIDAGRGSALLMVDRLTALVGLIAIASCGALAIGDGLTGAPLEVVIALLHFATAGCLGALAAVLGGQMPRPSWRRLAARSVPVAVATGGLLAFATGQVDTLGCAAVVGGAALGPAAAVTFDRLVPRWTPESRNAAAADGWLAGLAAAARSASCTVGAFRRRPLVLVVTSLLSVLCQLPLVLAAAMLSWAFTGSPPIGFEIQMVATGVAILTAGIPLPGGGLGVGEAAYDAIFRSATGTTLGVAGVFLALRLLLLLVPAALVVLPPLFGWIPGRWPKWRSSKPPDVAGRGPAASAMDTST